MKVAITVIVVLVLLNLTGCATQDKPEEVAVPKTDLHSAVYTDDLEAVGQHIKAGLDLNVLEPSRASTPLITAAYLGRTEAAKMLIAAGADLNYQNADGSNALHTAAVFGKTEIAKMLIDAGIDLNSQNKQGATALHTAAFLCRIEVVQALLAKGADKTLKNKSGRTAYETVAGPFEDIKVAYDAVGAGLKPLGLQLDYDQIKMTRPQIAEMLK